MSEERGFEVVDKRGAHGAEPEATGEPESATGNETPSGEAAPEGEAGFNPFAQITVRGVLEMSIHLLGERAWICMGLVPNPATGKIETDLNEARRAIDVLADLVKHAEADASAGEKRELQVMLTNLRMNFVRQSGQ